MPVILWPGHANPNKGKKGPELAQNQVGSCVQSIRRIGDLFSGESLS